MKKHYLIVLGGNSQGNKRWVQEMSTCLKQSYPTLRFGYSHWETEDRDIDFEKEIRLLSKQIKRKNIRSYSLVAKSAGFILALQGTASGVLRPRTIVGYGLSIEYAGYRGINLRTLIEHSAKATSAVCIQANKDPQGSLADTEKLIADTIPVVGIEGQTHDYNQFEAMSNIAKAFVSMHQPHCEHRIEEVKAWALQDAVNIVAQSPKKYSFRNNWLFNLSSRLCVFRFRGKKYILKRGLLQQIRKEKENAEKLSDLIKKTRIGKKKLVVVVPDVYTISSEEGCAVSEYVGPDCSELFYLGRRNILSWEEINDTQKKLCELTVQHRNLLPRNTIVVKNKVHLIDLEDVVFTAGPSNVDISLATTMLVGWRNVSSVSNNDVQSAFSTYKQHKDHEGLNEYETAFKNLAGLTDDSNDELRKIICESISATSRYEYSSSLLRIDDVLHYLSDALPIEVEVLVDLLLSREYGNGTNSLYRKLSNVVKIAWLQDLLNGSSEESRDFLFSQVRNILLTKITSECPRQEISDSIKVMISNGNPSFEPTPDYLSKLESHLSSEL